MVVTVCSLVLTGPLESCLALWSCDNDYGLLPVMLVLICIRHKFYWSFTVYLPRQTTVIADILSNYATHIYIGLAGGNSPLESPIE